MSRIPCRDLLEEKTNVSKSHKHWIRWSAKDGSIVPWIHKFKQLMVSSQLALL